MEQKGIFTLKSTENQDEEKVNKRAIKKWTQKKKREEEKNWKLKRKEDNENKMKTILECYFHAGI